MEEVLDALQGSLDYQSKISINCLYIIMILLHNWTKFDSTLYRI